MLKIPEFVAQSCMDLDGCDVPTVEKLAIVAAVVIPLVVVVCWNELQIPSFSLACYSLGKSYRLVSFAVLLKCSFLGG